MPVDARRLIRKMRGGAQAHLLEAGDGHFYVVKFRNNPQHRRILVNELVASVLLRYLGVATPETAIVDLTPQFLAGNPEICLQLGTRQQPAAPGWHFGSRYPGDPARTAVYDFLPDTLLRRVINFEDYLGVLVFDKWMGNADSRQSVFFRARLKDWAPEFPAGPQRMGYVAQMMDNGYVMNGPHWEFADSPLQGLYFRPVVYEKVRSLDDFQPWLDQVRYLPETLIDEAMRQVPPEWLEGDETELERLMARLLARRKRVGDLIEECRRGRVDPFPNWRG